MERLIIKGGRPLSGTVRVGGMKNAALPMMAATILAPGVHVLNNIPDLRDVTTMSHLLRIFGAKVYRHGHTLTLDTSTCDFPEAPYELVSTMRASFFVLGPLLARFGRAKVALPGGCAIGPRPVDLHLKGLRALGAEMDMEGGYVVAEARKLRGASVNFEIPSVGATENVLMAAVLAEGTTVIENAAKEPEISALAEFLRLMGAKISGDGMDRIEVEGVTSLSPAEMEVPPDRIETATFLIAAAATGGEVTVEGCLPEHITSVIGKLREAGAELQVQDGTIRIEGPPRPGPTDVVATPYPGYPTDLQPLHTALMTIAEGTSLISDRVFPERFTHVPELRRMGADISVEDRVAVVRGVRALDGAPVMAPDIRAGAALVVAGLAAKGETVISRVYHIDRGYERIEEKLRSLGAEVRRETT